jgi:hypothetical protein
MRSCKKKVEKVEQLEAGLGYMLERVDAWGNNIPPEGRKEGREERCARLVFAPNSVKSQYMKQ